MGNILYSERIKAIRSYFKMNKTEFATFTKIQRSSLSDFESGNREPSKEFLKTLGDIGISIDWFLFGNGDMLKARLGTSEDKNLHEKVLNRASNETLTARNEALVVVDGGVEQGVLIPVIAQGLSAGFGFDYEEGEIIRYIKVPAWLARKSKELVALPIYGESMEPTLSRGDLAVCDKGGFKDDGVYVLRDHERGLMFCKRVLWLPGGWTIKSDNPSYEPMKVDDKAIEIIARVIAAIKEVK